MKCVDTSIEVLVEFYEIALGQFRYGCGGYVWPVVFGFM